MSTETPESLSATLYFKQGGSDKIYHANIKPSGTGFVVNFAFGRRGNTLQTGSKTASHVDFASAKKIYDKLLAEKTAKGYSPGEEGTPYQQTDHENRATGILPQLLCAIEEAEAQRCIADAAWYAQEKFDGIRILIRKTGTRITGINRRGLVVALPQPVADVALTLGGDSWIIDGEAIGDVFVTFDVLEHAGINVRMQPYSQRLKMLSAVVKAGEIIRAAETAMTAPAKQTLLARLRQANREGIVFKRHVAVYSPGRPASGGDQVKFKFTATASCMVAGVNKSKRSVALELFDGKSRVGVGSVTIPPSTPIPTADTIIDVRYLYAYLGGSLYQPVYLGPRDDIEAEQCVLGQLKYKSAESEEG
ncbi:MAG: WGR domain-containing protein [Tepidiformaceae bacterium]